MGLQGERLAHGSYSNSGNYFLFLGNPPPPIFLLPMRGVVHSSALALCTPGAACRPCGWFVYCYCFGVGGGGGGLKALCESVSLFPTLLPSSGSLYKSFVANPMTTVDDIVAQALKKANLHDQDPRNYCIVQVPTSANGWWEWEEGEGREGGQDPSNYCGSGRYVGGGGGGQDPSNYCGSGRRGGRGTRTPATTVGVGGGEGGGPGPQQLLWEWEVRGGGGGGGGGQDPSNYRGGRGGEGGEGREGSQDPSDYCGRGKRGAEVGEREEGGWGWGMGGAKSHQSN